MTIPIQSQAAGLLGLLTSKFGGIGPPGMEDHLRTTLDLRDFYGVPVRQVLFRSQTAAQLDNANGWIAGGGAVTGGWFACQSIAAPAVPPDIVVPSNELWRVLNLTMFFERTTGSGGALAAGWVHGAFPADSVWAQLAEGTGTVAAGFRGTSGTNSDFLALPGSGPAFFMPQWDLGVLDFDLQVNLTYERYVL